LGARFLVDVLLAIENLILVHDLIVATSINNSQLRFCGLLLLLFSHEMDDGRVLELLSIVGVDSLQEQSVEAGQGLLAKFVKFILNRFVNSLIGLKEVLQLVGAISHILPLNEGLPLKLGEQPLWPSQNRISNHIRILNSLHNINQISHFSQFPGGLAHLGKLVLCLLTRPLARAHGEWVQQKEPFEVGLVSSLIDWVPCLFYFGHYVHD
jgi:hypothetical protein